jgi:hypothetical protein
MSFSDDNQFFNAVQSGDFKQVDYFLVNTSIDPSILDNKAIQVATENGNFLIIDRLLEDQRVDPNQGLRSLAKADDNIDPNVRMAILDRLLEDPRTDPSLGDNYAIIFASRCGIIKLVDRLLQDHRVDPSAQNNRAIIDACGFDDFNSYGKNRITVILRLLKDQRVDPRQLHRAMFDDISRECEFGDVENINIDQLRVIKYLSSDSRADPSMIMLFTLYRTDLTSNEKLSVISNLFKIYTDIDPSILSNKAINYASFMGYIDIVNFLLEDHRVNPSVSHSFGSSIVRASERGNLSVVTRLLQDPRVDPSVNDNWAIQAAVEKGHIEIIDYLLKDHRVDPNAAIESIYYMYEQNTQKRLNILERILQDPRVDLNKTNQIVWLLSLYNYNHYDNIDSTNNHENNIQNNMVVKRIFQNSYSKLFVFNNDSVRRFVDVITENENNFANKKHKKNKKLFLSLVQDSENMIVKKCNLIKEELMIKAWHPKRVEKLIVAGYDVEDM